MSLNPDQIQDIAQRLESQAFDTLLLSPQEYVALRHASLGTPDLAPAAVCGLKLIAHPLLGGMREPCWPEGVLRHKPWWLTEEAWAEHRQWMGDFFGWGRVAFAINRNAVKIVHDG